MPQGKRLKMCVLVETGESREKLVKSRSCQQEIALHYSIIDLNIEKLSFAEAVQV